MTYDPLNEKTRVIVGDALERLRELPNESVNMCLTSPPYFGLRDYGEDGQVGLEKTPDEYVARLVEIFREVKRVLRKDGTLWLNLGDSYAGARAGPQGETGQMSDRSVAASRCRTASKDQIVRGKRDAKRWGGGNLPHGNGLKSKDLIGIPWRVAFALQSDGWYLRQDIIWHKPNPMPESVQDRCTKAHEYVFTLSKSAKYFYDAEAIADPAAYSGLTGQDASGFKDPKLFNGKHGTDKITRGQGYGAAKGINGKGADRDGGFGSAETRNRRSVWTIPTMPYSGAHFATMSPQLATDCIKAGSRVGDIVLDPFGGAGTTALCATQLGRSAILIELNPSYEKLIRKRLKIGQIEKQERITEIDLGILDL